jgi:hypothetical protein
MSILNGSFTGQFEDAFDMESLREQIDQVRFFNPVSQIVHQPQIPCQRRGIAGNVRDLRRLELCQTPNHCFSQSSSRRVNYDQIRAQAGSLPQLLFGGRQNCLYLRWRIVTQVGE